MVRDNYHDYGPVIEYNDYDLNGIDPELLFGFDINKDGIKGRIPNRNQEDPEIMYFLGMFKKILIM